MTTTKHPAVLIHGVFGYGKRRPLWNRFVPYWPERALDAMRANYLMVDVGVLSSDHDRACEAFYQLYGGRVDYGKEHAHTHGHKRFGYTHNTALHPNWSEENPVHLIGHSFGATTAIELYQLLAQDYFGVGSSYKWVKSIISIAGPLSGTTLTHLFGLHDAKMVPYTLGHAIGASLCLWQRFHTQHPWIRGLFDYRMPQWEIIPSYRDAISPSCSVVASSDLAVYDITPSRRLDRNSRLQDMDKVVLVSIATSAHSQLPWIEVAIACLVVAAWGIASLSWWRQHTGGLAVSILIGVISVHWLVNRLADLDYATLPCLSFLRVQMNWCVRYLHEIFDGFDHDEWIHNDGAVNVASMLNPLQFHRADKDEADQDDDSDTSDSDAGSTASTVSSNASSRPLLSVVPLDLDAYASPQQSIDLGKSKRMVPGRWYVHQLQKNHLAGTHFDRDSPALFRKLLTVLATEAEWRASHVNDC